jgi:pimeloyl-ACP methyl ester carboxylesterase
MAAMRASADEGYDPRARRAKPSATRPGPAAYAPPVERHPAEATADLRSATSGVPDDLPELDREAEPGGYIVAADDGTRLHFLDWGTPALGAEASDGLADPGGPGRAAGPELPGVLLLHGLTVTAWSWTPVARRLVRATHVVAPDARGHGLSDAPTRGYDAETLALDALAVADASGLLAGPVILAGHGSGAIVAAEVAARLGDACRGLVLVDGGWDVADPVDPPTVEEWLRSIEEPPEVLASMAAFLADRAAFDPATWDGDQERAARASLVELPAGRVVLVARRHVLAATGTTLLEHDPVTALTRVAAPIAAFAAREDADGARTAALDRVSAAVRAAGRPAMTVVAFPVDGHDLLRYRPAAVAGAILDLARRAVMRDARSDPGVPSPR